MLPKLDKSDTGNQTPENCTGKCQAGKNESPAEVEGSYIAPNRLQLNDKQVLAALCDLLSRKNSVIAGLLVKINEYENSKNNQKTL